MTRSRLILLCALVLLAAGLVALWHSGPKDPEYQGKKLSEWMEDASLTSTNVQTEEARLAIQAIGPDALPYLMGQFTKSRPEFLTRAGEWLTRKTRIDLELEELRWRWIRAAAGINALGTNAMPALPVLISCLSDEDRYEYAAQAISGCGEMAPPQLLATYDSTNFVTLVGLVVTLAHLSRYTTSAIPPLIQFTRHTNSQIGAITIRLLRNFSIPPNQSVPAMVHALSSTNSSFRKNAIFTLGNMGGQATSAVPDLLLIMRGTDFVYAVLASNALYKIDPSALPRAAAP